MKVILSIAGSDSSGGAGIQADIKTAEYFKVFSTTAITAITAQNTTGVRDILNVSSQFVASQMRAIKDDFEISAIKIGMLFNKDIIDEVENFIKDLNIPIVLDPVFVSKAGSVLMSEENIKYMQNLFKYATILTPNLYEAKSLFGKNLDVKAPCNVLVKKLKKDNKSIDRLFYINGDIKEFEDEFLDTENLHGTGCSFSTAITCSLALGNSLENSIKISKEFITKAIKNAPNLGHGKGPILHNLNNI